MCRLKFPFSKEDYLNMKDKAMLNKNECPQFIHTERKILVHLPQYRVRRVCITCPHRPVNDEYHFLMTCKNYDQDHTKMQQEVTKICSNFINLGNHDKLLTAGVEVARVK